MPFNDFFFNFCNSRFNSWVGKNTITCTSSSASEEPTSAHQTVETVRGTRRHRKSNETRGQMSV